jgi:hypothetical protein
MAVPVAWAHLTGSEVWGELAPEQHGFETIDLRLHVSRAPELHVKLVLLALDLNPLLFDTTPLFSKLCTDCRVSSHLSLPFFFDESDPLSEVNARVK